MRESIWLVGVVLFSMLNITSAAFINGVERFDGTVKDTVTWQEHALYGGVFSQDDKLIFNMVQSNLMSYTTRNSYHVRRGRVVQVEFHQQPQGEAESYLSIRSGAVTLSLKYDYWPPSHQYQLVAMVNNTGTIFGKGTPPPSPDNPYILRIEHESSTSSVFSVFASDMSLIDSIDISHTAVSDNFVISLNSWAYSGGITVFDNLRIVPEPASILLLGLGGLVLRKRKR